MLSPPDAKNAVIFVSIVTTRAGVEGIGRHDTDGRRVADRQTNNFIDARKRSSGSEVLGHADIARDIPQ
ncbi:MAG: hypothetical protein ACKOYJ_00285 [Planctomycetia bacterium]